MLDESTDRQIVRKSYELITAKNSWSEIEGKLLATFIKELNPKSETDFREIKISIASIEELWNTKINTTNLRNLCVELKRKVYEIPEYRSKEVKQKDGTMKTIIDESKVKAYDYVSLFDEVKYHLDEKFISFKFDEKMHPHLLDFTRFIKYKIENILQFKSSYSISFYELFKAQEFKKETIKKLVLEVEYIHKWLNLPKSYKIYNNFKQKVLIPVMNDLKKHSDIYFNFKENKTGRKVTHIEFLITQNVSKQERAELFGNDDFDTKYEKYKGKSCLYKGRYFMNIRRITPFDDFIKVEFENGDSIKYPTLKDLESTLWEN